MKLINSGIKIVLICLIALVSCNQKSEKKRILEKSVMVDLILELQNAESLASRVSVNSTDSSKVVFRYLSNNIYKKYNTDSAQFVKSYDYYAGLNKELIEIYKLAEERLKKKKEKDNKKNK